MVYVVVALWKWTPLFLSVSTVSWTWSGLRAQMATSTPSSANVLYSVEVEAKAH
jgi:hypothetical protein